MDEQGLASQIIGTGAERALIALHEHGQLLGREAVNEDGETFDVSEGIAVLVDLGLAYGEQRLAACWVADISPMGSRVAELINASHQHGPLRWDAVERALVADLLRVGTRCAPDWGVTSVRGQPVTDAERENALNNLEKWGYVKVRHAWEIGPACVEGLAAAHRVIGALPT